MPKINWKEYNEKLVKRGEIFIQSEFIENSIHERKELR